MDRASELLLAGDTRGAAEAAEVAFSTARAQRSHHLVTGTWIFLLDTRAADPEATLSMDYREQVEGAFAWAETMPEEIQVWLFPALEEHLERLGFRRLVERARTRSRAAAAWLEKGNLNVTTRLQRFHLDDLEHGRALDARAVAGDRTAAFYAQEGFDATGELLRRAAHRWREVGRADRAEFLDGLAHALVVHLVRAHVEAGSSVDDIARTLVEDLGLGAIPAIKALREGAGIGLGAAKDAVHPRLPEAVRQVAERLWDEVETVFASDEESPASEP
jgi:hypothetical protein